MPRSNHNTNDSFILDKQENWAQNLDWWEYPSKGPGTKGFLPKEEMLSIEISEMTETLSII